MKLLLSHCETNWWKGLVETGEGLFGVTLFPGSATKPWTAVLECKGWVELTEGSPLITAIQAALGEMKGKEGCQDDLERV